jgi:alkanesulfonate monooxygenase SsuD/methylene tetrahydromethanopterin reductase-like flavin-dependent oxidoreductase (luciferase family)
VSITVRLHALGVDPVGELRDQIALIESAGLDGIFATDHLFISQGRPRREGRAGGDPFVKLAVAGALSPRLTLGTSVVNIGLAHPALAIRGFIELARQFGGERVIAGIGGGWNREEFDALGLDFPALPDRMDRLEDAARLARELFDRGFVEGGGASVAVRELSLGAPTTPPPRLLLGGGSDRLLELAGRYAEIVDLNGSSRRLPLGGPHPALKDLARRYTTTVADLEDSVARVRASAAAAGRDADAIEFSILVGAVRFCPTNEIEAVEAGLCADAAIAPQSLADCPYVFVGPAERIRDQLAERVSRLALRHLIFVPLAHDVLVRWREEIAA